MPAEKQPSDRRTLIYAALALGIAAVLLALWAAWEARAPSVETNETAARLERIEAEQADQRSTLDALESRFQELSRRIEPAEEAGPSPQTVPPESSPAEELPQPQNLPPEGFDLTPDE